MRRIVAMILIFLVLSGCSSVVSKVQDKAQSKFQSFLGNQFGKRLGSGVDVALAQLSKKGGYLDDPLVRILLPPPVGMAIGVARELQANPQAALMQTLMNQAAENAIPGAGPVLKTVVKNMDGPTLQKLLDGGPTAATDYMKEKGGAMVTAAVLPGVTQQLQATGAVELYGKLLEAKQTADQVTAAAGSASQQAEITQQQAESAQPQAVQAVSQDQLGQYVAEQAVSGLFKKVADQELAVRGALEPLQ